MTSYESKNAKAVLEQVEARIAEIEAGQRYSYPMREVYADLSIFDWFRSSLSKSALKDMRKFLKAAIKRGYTGYVCFKVGSTGCANGMWAYKEESNTGYSPDGEFLYKSFTPEYNCWSFKAADGETYPEKWNGCKTIKQLDALMAEVA